MRSTFSRREMLKSGAAIAGYALTAGQAAARSERVEGLIAAMTLAEKAGQLSCFSDAIRTPRTTVNPGLPLTPRWST